MPMIIASAVISTGRKRPKPASSAASSGVAPARQFVLREAHHQDAVRRRHAHAHDRAGQRRHADRGVRDEQHPDDAGQRRRQRRDDDEGIQPATGSSRRSAGRPARSPAPGRPAGPRNDVRIVSICPRTTICDPRGRSFFAASTIGAISSRHAAEVAPLHRSEDVDDRLHVVVRHDRRARPRGAPTRRPSSICGARPIRSPAIGMRLEVLQRVHPVLRRHRRHVVADAGGRVQPEGRRGLAAAAQRDQQVVGDVALGEPDLRGARAIDVDLERRLVRHLVHAQVDDAGDLDRAWSAASTANRRFAS